MAKYIIMPDSFKGTMSSAEVCDIMKRAVASRRPDAGIIAAPVADGGEGTVDSFIRAVGGVRIEKQVTGPFKETVHGFYGLTDGAAIIEIAAAAGFSLVKGAGNPEIATSYGVGELIRDAVEKGSKKIILGLGGSCTNDGGAGMASAVGVKFYNRGGRAFTPVGGDLSEIDRIDVTRAGKLLSGVSVEAMCDIDNPLFGENGAAYIFAPQKGADAAMVKRLDDNLKYFSSRIEQNLGFDVSGLVGGGAAGGMGAGAYAFLNAELRSGIDVILDLIGFEQLIEGCDLILTGEGRLDSQSLRGKAVAGIARRAKAHNIPVIAVVGSVSGDMSRIYEEGVTSIYTTLPEDRKPEEIKDYCAVDLEAAMKKIPL